VDYKKYLPSKRFQVSLAIAILLILIALAFSYEKPFKNNGLIATSSWLGVEETDPETLALEKEADAEYEALNPTEKISRNILSNIIANQPANSGMDQDTIDAIVQKALEDMPKKDFLGSITESNLNIIGYNETTFSKDAASYRKEYYYKTDEALKTISSNIKILTSELTSGEMIDSEAFESTNSAYTKEIERLVAVSIPATSDSEIVKLHLRIINSLEKLIAINNDIISASSENDSATVYADLLLFTETDKYLAKTIDTMDGILGIDRTK